MRALVVYESLYGNTHAVADRIGTGLRATHDVTVKSVGAMTAGDLDGVDFLVVGGPTHAHAMSRKSTRKAAIEAAEKPDSGLTVDPGPIEPGIRGWLGGFVTLACEAAAFDTRIDAPAMFTGRASKGIAKRLTSHGAHLVVDPESFLVDKHNALVTGELNRAEAWGRSLAQATQARHVA